MDDFVIINGVLIRYDGNDQDIVIPDSVQRIGDRVFECDENITSVTIPNSVTIIGADAFHQCSSLTSITIPDSVISIGKFAFSECTSLKSAVLSKGLTRITKGMFTMCTALTSVTIPDSVKSIELWAFSGCENLTDFTMPATVSSIGSAAFSGCYGLANESGLVLIRDFLQACKRDVTSVIVPNYITHISGEAFNGCEKLTDVTIPNSVYSIGYAAFHGCRSLQHLTIPQTVTYIGYSAFAGCESLTDVTIPYAIKCIPQDLFGGCTSLTHVTLPDGITSIEEGAFMNCTSLQSIDIPSAVSSIGAHAFENCSSLTSIKLPDWVTSIEPRTFAECSNLKSITIPASVEQIGEEVFAGCSQLESLQNNSKASLGKKTFGDSLPKKLLGDLETLLPQLSDDDVTQLFLSPPAWEKQTPENKLSIFLSHQNKNMLLKYVSCMTQKDLDGIASALLERLSTSPQRKDYTAAANLMLYFPTKLTEQQLSTLYAALKKIKAAAKLVTKVEADEAIAKRLHLNQEALSPEESLVVAALDAQGMLKKDLVKKLRSLYAITEADLPELRRKDGTIEPPLILMWLLAAHETASEFNNFDVYAAWNKPGLCPEATALVQYLDPQSLQAAMLQLADTYLGKPCRSKKMLLSYPICRYADEDTIEELLSRAPKWRSKTSGDDAPPVRTLRYASWYSEQWAVIPFAERYGGMYGADLDEYTEIRDTNVRDLYDTVLPNLGFNQDGQLHYDLGSTTVTVTLEKDFSLSLYDNGQNKVVQRIPKSGNDDVLAAQAAKSLSRLRTHVQTAAKLRFKMLFEDFLDEYYESASHWKTLYLENPLLRNTANYIVWKHGEQLFTLSGNQPILSDGAPYKLNALAIVPAHPMEMTPADISAWQAYFLHHKLAQPFDQLGEPVIPEADIHEDRYVGTSIPCSCFLRQEKHGFLFPFELANMSQTFDIDLAGCTLVVKNVTPGFIAQASSYEVQKFTFKKYTRMVNHIVACLDQASLDSRIVQNDSSVAQYIHNLTFAQLQDYLHLATENGCIAATAALLEYIHAHFEGVKPLAELALD